MAQKSIETGVDKLLDLVEQKKRLSIGEAANYLGVSIPILQEWADFLEDEGLITIEYKLSKTYLCERKLNKKEVEKKVKEYSSKKDAFTRKVEMAITSMQDESAGFEKLKDEVKKLNDAIGTDIEQVREQLQELKHYEELKKNIDKDIIQQKLEYQQMLENVHRQISAQRKKYESFIEEIETEKGKIEEAKVELSYLENREENIRKRVDALNQVVKSVSEKILDQKNSIKASITKINAVLEDTEKLHKDMTDKMKTELEPVIKTADEKEEKILAVQDSILKKIMERKKTIEKYKLESIEASEEFKVFFERKAKIHELVASLDKEKLEIERGLQELINKARGFALSLKSDDVKSYVKELQESFSGLEKKRNSFVNKLGELTDRITKK
jgi:chromosome segregation ATPase